MYGKKAIFNVCEGLYLYKALSQVANYQSIMRYSQHQSSYKVSMKSVKYNIACKLNMDECVFDRGTENKQYGMKIVCRERIN